MVYSVCIQAQFTWVGLTSSGSYPWLQPAWFQERVAPHLGGGGVFVSYLKRRSNHLVTQNWIVLWNKEENEMADRWRSSEQRGLLSERRRGLEVFFLLEQRVKYSWEGNKHRCWAVCHVRSHSDKKAKHCFGEICKMLPFICVYICFTEHALSPVSQRLSLLHLFCNDSVSIREYQSHSLLISEGNFPLLIYHAERLLSTSAAMLPQKLHC